MRRQASFRRASAANTKAKRVERPRIITGAAKGKRLLLPRGNPDLRPMLDRIKTAIFNILGPGFPYAKVLDLFAGSGSLGLEAASRGAEFVTMVDNERQTVEVLLRNAREAKLEDGVRVENRDALEFLATDKDEYDLIFLDPPFAWSREGRLKSLVERALPRLAPGGVAVLRTPVSPAVRRKPRGEAKHLPQDSAPDNVSAEFVAGFNCPGRVIDRRRYGKSAVLFISRDGESDAGG